MLNRVKTMLKYKKLVGQISLKEIFLRGNLVGKITIYRVLIEFIFYPFWQTELPCVQSFAAARVKEHAPEDQQIHPLMRDL